MQTDEILAGEFDRVYAALGKLSFWFAVLDEFLTDAVVRLVNAGTPEAIEVLLGRETAGRKLERLEELCTFYARAHNADDSQNLQELRMLFGHAKRHIEQRNRYVHFAVRFNRSTLQTYLRHPKTEEPLDLTDAVVVPLCLNFADLAPKLSRALRGFIEDLDRSGQHNGTM